MKSDLYLKVVLTVIAAALVMLALQNMGVGIVTRATAAPDPVAMGQSSGRIDVNVVSIGGYSVYGGELDVNVKDMPDVTVDTGYGGLDVNVTNYRDFQ